MRLKSQKKKDEGKKSMNRTHDNLKEFKNGNLNIKFSAEMLEEIKKNTHVDSMSTLSDLLFWNDCYIVGDSFCISNYAMAISIYNNYLDVLYTLNLSDLENKLIAGKTLKLYAQKVSSDDRNMLESEGF